MSKSTSGILVPFTANSVARCQSIDPAPGQREVDALWDFSFKYGDARFWSSGLWNGLFGWRFSMTGAFSFETRL